MLTLDYHTKNFICKIPGNIKINLNKDENSNAH